jgi:NADH-quinone oxidoreductase subunit G
MPELLIDGLEIEVETGTKVITAAERLGIMIPRFCHHPGLGSVGACRMCAVKFLQGPVKGLQMSCMIEARDGMVISTTDDEAVDFRRHIIEWLMLHHPHDCPVCDEGGQCLLQDETVSGGHGIRRYRGKKRTYRDQDLGVFVQHEMNRCIHCYRCRRFYQDFAGYRDLGAMQIANRVYFGRHCDGPLQSPFAGNLIDLCPTGVYTDKPSRFKGRRWDFERGPSLCIHCSLGCRIVANARYRELVRVEAAFSEAVNGYFICDRGRYGFYYANHPERPRHARLAGEEVGWEAGVRGAAERLTQIIRAHGPAAIAGLGSLRSSLQTQGLLKHLCNRYGWRQPAYFIDPGLQRKTQQAVSRLDERIAVSLREIERADFILAVGVDPVNEAPMLALAMRQAFRNGAAVAVIDPRPVFLPCDFTHLAAAPGDLERCLGLVMRAIVPRSTAAGLGPAALEFHDALPGGHTPEASLQDRIAALTARLQSCRRPVVVCGTDIVSENTPALAADCVLLLRTVKERAGLFFALTGANAFGAALLSSAEGFFVDTLEAIENGAVKALLVVESDPFRCFPDRERLQQAIDRLELVLVLDCLPSEMARRAHVLLPTATLFETGSCFVNQEGRVQYAERIHHGGSPIGQVSAGSHPARVFQSAVPGGEPKPAWQALAQIAQNLSPQEDEILQDELWTLLARDHPALAELADPVRRIDGRRIIPAQSGATPFSFRPASALKQPPRNQLQLVLVDWTFGAEELSGYSSVLQHVEKAPCLFMHAEDAAGAGLSDGDRILLHLDTGSVQAKLCVSPNMAQGVVVLPRHRQLAWQKLRQYPVMVSFGQIEKVR